MRGLYSLFAYEYVAATSFPGPFAAFVFFFYLYAAKNDHGPTK